MEVAEQEPTVDRRRSKSEILSDNDSEQDESVMVWAVTSELDIPIQPENPNKFLETRPLPSEFLDNDSNPDEGLTRKPRIVSQPSAILTNAPITDIADRVRLIRVVAGLAALFLISGMIWFFATRSDSNDGDFTSVPASDTSRQLAEESQEFDQANGRAISEAEDGSRVGRFSATDIGATEDLVETSEAATDEAEGDELNASEEPTSTDTDDTDDSATTQLEIDNAAEDESDDLEDATTEDAVESEEELEPASAEPNTPVDPVVPETPAPVDPPVAPHTVRVTIRSTVDGVGLAGVLIRLKADSTGETVSSLSSTTGVSNLQMPAGCGTATFAPPTGYELVTASQSTRRLCTQAHELSTTAWFKRTEATPFPRPAASPTVRWDSQSSCDNGLRLFGADVSNLPTNARKVRVVLFDNADNFVHGSHTYTATSSGEVRAELGGILPGSGNIRIVNASNDAWIASRYMTFRSC